MCMHSSYESNVMMELNRDGNLGSCMQTMKHASNKVCSNF